MRHHHIIIASMVAVTSIVLSSCASPTKEVREAARATAAQMSLLSSDLKRFAEVEQRVVGYRAEAISRFANAVEDLNADNNAYLLAVQGTAEIAGPRYLDPRHRVVRVLAEGSTALAKAQIRTQEAKTSSLSRLKENLVKPANISKEIDKVSKKIGKLGQNPALKDTGAFYISFGKTIYKNIKDLEKQTSDAETKAKSSSNKATPSE